MNATAASFIEPKLWPTVWKLIRLRGVILVSSFRRAKVSRKIGMLFLGMLIAAGLAFAFFLSWLLLRFVRSPQLVELLGDSLPMLESIPVMIVTAEAVIILMTSFGVLLQALYLAGDMDFLLSAPVPIRAIFITKMLQAILPNFGFVLLFSLPVLYGLGASSGYNWLYYPLVLLVLASLALAVAGLSSLLVMAAVRVFPARRVAELLGFLVATVSLICSQSGQFMRYVDVSQQQTTQLFSMMARFDVPWSPLAWAGRGLAEIGAGRWAAGGAHLLGILLLCSGLFAISLVTAERLYYSGWARVQVSTRKKRNNRASTRPLLQTGLLGGVLSNLLPRDVAGIMSKDFMMLRRDLRNMSQLITPLILGVVYAFMLIRGGGQAPAGRGEAPQIFIDALNNMLVYSNVGISLFVGWSLLGRLASMGFSQEGKQYWLLKAAPVSPTRLLASKYLVAYLPTLAMGGVFLLILSVMQRASPGSMLVSLLVVVLTLAGLAGVTLAFGVIGANFNWEDPRKITQGGTGCLSAICSVAFLIISLGLFFGPALLLGLFSLSAGLGQAIGILLGSTFCLGVGGFSLWAVRGRVARLAEE